MSDFQLYLFPDNEILSLATINHAKRLYLPAISQAIASLSDLYEIIEDNPKEYNTKDPINYNALLIVEKILIEHIDELKTIKQNLTLFIHKQRLAEKYKGKKETG